MIDAQALRDAIRLGDVAWEAEVLAVQHRLANCQMRDGDNPGKGEEWRRLHRIFHRTLISACGSDWLMRFHDLLFDQAVRYRALAGAYRIDRRRNVDEEHAAIVRAVIARDAEAAVAAIEAHYARASICWPDCPESWSAPPANNRNSPRRAVV